MKKIVDTQLGRSLARWGRRAGLAYANLAGLVPVGVGAGNEHPRMANGENVYFVTDDFVHDAVGAAEGLAEFVGVRWDCLETFERNASAGMGEVLKLHHAFVNVGMPSQSVIRVKFLCNSSENAREELPRVRRPLGCHAFSSRCCLRFRSISRISSMTCRCGMPLPSANSRREISMSRESSILSMRVSKSSASMRYDVARPFCVMRIGRCVSRGRLMYDEKFWRHSEKGTTSSDGRQRLMGRSISVGMVLSPLMESIVQNFALLVKVAA